LPAGVDVIVVGAGAAGLSAAIRGAAAGLSTVVVEAASIGGQTVITPLLRDYPGFPDGVGGAELMQRFYQQALGLGAEFVSRRAVGFEVDGVERRLRLADGSGISGQTVILATGAALRRTGIQGVDKLAGAGVSYGVAVDDPAAITGDDVVVTGIDDTAGRASLALARYATNVTLVLRGALEAILSAEVANAIDRTRNIRVRVNTQVVDGFGESRLEGVVVRHRVSGTTEAVRARALFALLGAEPGSAWLKGVVQRDGQGYVLTGQDLVTGALPGDWPLRRLPLMLETSIPGVFAAGDVRHGTSKQASAASIEGAVSVTQAQRYLRELASVPIAATP
jgi:thioredoxin reductase (NADPH)